MNRGRIPDGRDWLDRLLAAPTVEPDTPARARALYGAGTLAFMQGDAEAALPLHQESLGIAERLGDEEAIADALIVVEEARTMSLEEAVAYAGRSAG